MPDFDSLLSGAVGTAERPKPWPAGPFLLVVKDRKFDKSSQKKTDYVEFTFGVVRPLEGVDMDELAALKNWQEKTIKDTFYLTEDALYRLDDFLKLFPGLEGMGRREAIEEVIKEMEVIGNMVQRPYTTKSNEPAIASEIGSYAKAD